MPELCNYFKVSEDSMQLSISLFILGASISQIFYGAISDKYGRKVGLITGLVASLIGTSTLVFAESADMFNFGRLLQGLGLGSCIAVPRSILPDLYSGKKLATYGSYMAMAAPIVLSTAPIIGAYIQYIYSWRGIFQFLLLYSICLIGLVIFKLPETNNFKANNATDLKIIKTNIIKILSETTYIAGTICSSAVMFSVYFYISSSPFIIQNQAGASYIEYSWMMGANGIMIMAGAFINKTLIKYFSLNKMIKIGALTNLSCGLLLLAVVFFITQLSPLFVVLPCFLIFIGCGFTFSNSLAICLEKVHKNALGVAVALFSTVQMLGGFLGSYSTSLISDDGVLSLSLAIIIPSTLSFLSIKIFIKEE